MDVIIRDEPWYLYDDNVIDDEEEEDDTEDQGEGYCQMCNGSGEGQFDGSICPACKGKGE